MMLHRLHSLLLAFMLAFAPAASFASQNQLSSPATGTVSGLQLTNNYNNALDSLNTCNSGTAAPTNQLTGSASLGNCWLNSTSSPYPVGFNDGTANWPKIGWLDATAHAWNVQIGGGATTLASATTTDLCSITPSYLTITGTTTITGFGATCPAGVVKLITFNNVLTLTYNGSSLIIPGAASVTTAAGDQATVVALGSGNWQVANYSPANGAALVNPSVDVGAVEWMFGFNAPSVKYLFGQGQAVSRATYATLQGVVTSVQSATRTNGSPTITGLSDTTQIGAGAGFEMAGFAFPTTVLSCTSSTCTLSRNASSSATSNATFFPYGNGDGTTTFNMPDCRGVALAGRDNMGGSARGMLTTAFALVNPDALGMTLGGQSQTLTMAQLPATPAPLNAQVPTPTTGGLAAEAPNSGTGASAVGSVGGAVNLFISASFLGFDTKFVTGNTANLGSGNAHSIVPPMLTANCLVRALP